MLILSPSCLTRRPPVLYPHTHSYHRANDEAPVSCASFASLNAGLYEDQESTEIRSAGKDQEVNVAELTESFTPTPTERLSNAERLRRRLPLLPPRRRSGLCEWSISLSDSASVADFSVLLIVVPRASFVPRMTYTGRIQVRSMSGSSMGYQQLGKLESNFYQALSRTQSLSSRKAKLTKP